ncbi:MAG: hypothetical protein IJ366_07695 [Clostridia bacterium]|nr:hypothetical protein [Clostridia bacterium]
MTDKEKAKYYESLYWELTFGISEAIKKLQQLQDSIDDRRRYVESHGEPDPFMERAAKFKSSSFFSTEIK